MDRLQQAVGGTGVGQPDQLGQLGGLVEPALARVARVLDQGLRVALDGGHDPGPGVADDLFGLLLSDVEVACAGLLGGAKDPVGGGLVGDPHHGGEVSRIGHPGFVGPAGVLDQLHRVAVDGGRVRARGRRGEVSHWC